MTHRASSHLGPSPERFWPAWLFSLVFHSSAIVIMGLLIQAAPPQPDLLGHSEGIVLETTRISGDTSDGDAGGNDSPAAIVEPLQPVEMLSDVPSELPPVVVESTPPTQLIPSVAPTPVASINADGAAANAAQVNPGGAGAGNGSGDPGGDASVSVFGVQGQGRKFVYLFDRSSSMEGAPLAAAKRQLLESLASLESTHQFHIVFFNTRTQPFSVSSPGRRIAFATDRNKQLAANFVGGITADGGTDRLTALKAAIAFAPDVIFFLTDADDPMSPAELAEIARDNSRARAAICTIEFGRRQSPSPGSFLAELAHQSGGQYGYVNTATLSP
jgi:hypothetical protein